MGKTTDSNKQISVGADSRCADIALGRRSAHQRKQAHGKRPYRRCRARIRPEEKVSQNEAPVSDKLKTSKKPVRGIRGMNGKQAAMVFVVVIVILTMISEFARISSAASVDNKAELVRGGKK